MLKDDGYLAPNAPVTNHFGSRVFSRFPGGRLIVLSAVGFNRERTREMVSVQSDCRWKDHFVGCHEVHTVGLRKTNGRWDPSGIGCHGIADAQICLLDSALPRQLRCANLYGIFGVQEDVGAECGEQDRSASYQFS
jgi:hypothetical protein